MVLTKDAVSPTTKLSKNRSTKALARNRQITFQR
jgi:hypothetical protein